MAETFYSQGCLARLGARFWSERHHHAGRREAQPGKTKLRVGCSGSKSAKKGHSPTRGNALRGLQSLLTSRQRAEFDRRPNARKLLDTVVVGRPDQERLDGPCPPTAASIWVLTSTSCGIVPQPADEGQHRGREKAADEQSGERASPRAMRPIPTPTDKPRIARVASGCRPHRPGTRFRG